MAEQTAVSSDTEAEASTDQPEAPESDTDEPMPEEAIDDAIDSLGDEGFDVFRGREFISIREIGHIAPNRTVAEEYFEGKEAVMLGYNNSTNEIVLLPLEHDIDRRDVFAAQPMEGRIHIAATRFFKEIGVEIEQTVRYSPEWNEELGGDNIDGGLVIDLDDEGEIPQRDNNESDSGEESDSN